MNRRLILAVIFFLTVLIAVLHSAAIEHHLYWKFWWFDMVVHFLGGVIVSLGALWFLFLSRYVPAPSVGRNGMFAIALLAIVVIGISWEVFEVLSGIPIEENFVFDTCIDLMMDLLGACVGYVYFRGGRPSRLRYV